MLAEFEAILRGSLRETERQRERERRRTEYDIFCHGETRFPERRLKFHDKGGGVFETPFLLSCSMRSGLKIHMNKKMRLEQFDSKSYDKTFEHEELDVDLQKLCCFWKLLILI